VGPPSTPCIELDTTFLQVQIIFVPIYFELWTRTVQQLVPTFHTACADALAVGLGDPLDRSSRTIKPGFDLGRGELNSAHSHTIQSSLQLSLMRTTA